ncbi:unnamed protein product [Schistosoma turkestanicum]|nr:unnamed protein product [Schistosoma turkestanicum]
MYRDIPFQKIFLLLSLQSSVKDAMDPLPDINFEELLSIQSYSIRLTNLKYGTRLGNGSVNNVLNIQHPNKRETIDEYENCTTELYKFNQNSILSEDIIKTIEMEERDFGVQHSFIHYFI